MTGLSIFALTVFLLAGDQVSSVVPEGFPQADEFVTYWSPIGFQIIVKSKGELLSELTIPRGVFLEIKAKQSSNPNLDRLRPVVFYGTVSIRTKVDPRVAGSMTEIMKGSPWELHIEDAEVVVVPSLPK